MKEFKYGEWERLASEGADVIADEEWDEYLAHSCLSSQHEDQIVAFVVTGERGNVTSRNHRDKHDSIDVKKFELMGFLITELQTVFRSTRQIQLFFHKFHPDEDTKDLINGHNFDGVKVEEWIFDDGEKLKKMLDERIERLIKIEGCEVGEIGLFQPREYEKPQPINNIFISSGQLRSLEFPVMIVVKPYDSAIYVSLSRAICHLIVFVERKKNHC
jgi:DNA helicase IV